MMVKVEFWFDFSSPYAYFASEQMDLFAQETGAEVSWRPFLLGTVFPKTRMAPLVDMPMRGDYARHDWLRIARQIGVPFAPPERHPYAATKVSRAFYWLEANQPDRAMTFAHAAFRAHFVDGHDPSEAHVVADIASASGVASDELLAAIQRKETKDDLRRRVDEAHAKNVFGSPFFLVDGEPFWGWDRMPMMRQWIERGGW